MGHATSAPRGKSCTVSNCHVTKTMPNQLNSGARDLFQTNFFYRDVFQIFFLQGRKSKLAQITGTIIIFKPKKKHIVDLLNLPSRNFSHLLSLFHSIALTCSLFLTRRGLRHFSSLSPDLRYYELVIGRLGIENCFWIDDWTEMWTIDLELKMVHVFIW